jgi:hypothetical protein
MKCPICVKEIIPSIEKYMVQINVEEERLVYHCCTVYMDFDEERNTWTQYNYLYGKISICADLDEDVTIIYKEQMPNTNRYDAMLRIKGFFLPEIINDIPEFEQLIQRLLKLKAFI